MLSALSAISLIDSLSAPDGPKISLSLHSDLGSKRFHPAKQLTLRNLSAALTSHTCRFSVAAKRGMQHEEVPVVSRFPKIILIVLVILVGYGVYTQVRAATRDAIPPATTDVPLAHTSAKQEAVFAGGCFWGVQSVFERVKGVLDTTAGYAGGSKDTATYAQVGTETTGHAESVRVVYDPSVITYGQLLRIFFSVAHDPTELNRQGPDVGTSYRSAIFYENDEQHRLAEAYISQLDDAHAFSKKILTQVTPLKGFYRAEDYHQDYALHNPENPYILVCDKPKVEALKHQFPELFKDYKGK